MTIIRLSDLSPDARAKARKQLGMPVKRVRRTVAQYKPTTLLDSTEQQRELWSIKAHLSVIAARIPQRPISESVKEIRAIIDLLEAHYAQWPRESHSKARKGTL